MGLFQAIGREYKTISVLKGIKSWLDPINLDGTQLVPDDFEAVVDRYRDNVFCRFEGQITTYGELEVLANQIAHWALGLGLKSGDAVALFMENRPEYIAIWYGLSKIGVSTGLINHNLNDDALAHCINIANAKIVITGEEQDEAIAGAHSLLQGAPKVWTLGGQHGDDLHAALAAASHTRPDRSHRETLRAKDLCLYVYTSGTTGLPKAAKLSHARLQSIMRAFIAPCRVTARDRVYIALPLYHSTGGICAVGIAMNTGAAIVLRKKFSAKAFWDDCADQGVTVIVYIGELCRYLINQPKHPKEAAHKIRTGFGNGLRPDIWEEFHERFNIPYLAEFYGSTEGNVSFVNTDGTVGAVGRVPSYFENSVYGHVAFVKFDIEEEAPVRGEDGFCIRTEPGEVGEVLGKLGQETRTRFEGYNSESETKKKILTNVFEDGDMWFRTGDLMKKDAQGYIYFVDRVGDTFRWKGENVATNEVSEVFAKADGVDMVNVYGVEVPGTDGKAGMAALTVSDEIDFSTLHTWLCERLPKYAVPLFLRIQKEAETTGTMKYRKVDLVKEGFDPKKCDEPLWFFDPDEGRYVELNADAFETINSGAVKF